MSGPGVKPSDVSGVRSRLLWPQFPHSATDKLEVRGVGNRRPLESVFVPIILLLNNDNPNPSSGQITQLESLLVRTIIDKNDPAIVFAAKGPAKWIKN